MKKITITIMLLLFVAGTAFAQGDTTKRNRKGKDFSEIMPHAGDIVIGVDMARLIMSINNSITNAGAGNPVVAFQSDFFAKYFIMDKSALRFRLGIGVNNRTDRAFVRDDAENLRNPAMDNPITEAKTVDVHKVRNMNFELGVGYEFRRSLWRLQGYLGCEVFGGFEMNKNIYTYGNPMTATNQNPTFDPFLPAPIINGYRPLESIKGNAFVAGAAIYFGADLFICRNVSIGAEFNLEGRYRRVGELGMMTETWLLDQAYKAEEKTTPVTSTFRLVPRGRFNLSFYF